MSAILVQSALGTNQSGSFTTSGGVLFLNCTATFPSNTTVGSLLVLIAYHNQHRTSGSGFAPASFVISGGVTWNSLLSAGFDGTADRQNSTLFFRGNSPSVSSGTTITAQLQTSGGAGAANGTEVAEFAIYEFSGLVASNSTVVGGALIDTNSTRSSQTGGSPSTVNLTTTVSDLVLAFFKGNSSNDTAGTGYALGQNMVAATAGQMQYNGNVSSGSISTAFVGAQTNWGCAAVAFKLAAATDAVRTQDCLIGF